MQGCGCPKDLVLTSSVKAPLGHIPRGQESGLQSLFGAPH